MEKAKPCGNDDELDVEYGHADNRYWCRGKLSKELPPISAKDDAEDNGLD